jgi:hypothetical protein
MDLMNIMENLSRKMCNSPSSIRSLIPVPSIIAFGIQMLTDIQSTTAKYLLLIIIFYWLIGCV